MEMGRSQGSLQQELPDTPLPAAASPITFLKTALTPQVLLKPPVPRVPGKVQVGQGRVKAELEASARPRALIPGDGGGGLTIRETPPPSSTTPPSSGLPTSWRQPSLC